MKLTPLIVPLENALGDLSPAECCTLVGELERVQEKSAEHMVRPAGHEPAACGFEVRNHRNGPIGDRLLCFHEQFAKFEDYRHEGEAV